jgi:hypothetical protein
MLTDRLTFITDDSGQDRAFYDIAGATLIKPTDGAILMRFVANREFVILSGFPGSVAMSGIATTGESVYTIQRNGDNIGIITFAESEVEGTFADDFELDDHFFDPGDMLTLVSPNPADESHDDIAWTIAARIAFF